jgi:hypothetical protein
VRKREIESGPEYGGKECPYEYRYMLMLMLVRYEWY